MPAIIEAKCPGCRAILRFPSAWADAPLRCKRCGLITAGNPAPPTPPRFPVAIALPGPPSWLVRRRWSKVAFLGTWLLGMVLLASATYWALTSQPGSPRKELRARAAPSSPAVKAVPAAPAATPTVAAPEVPAVSVPPAATPAPVEPPVKPPPAPAPAKVALQLSPEEQMILDLTNRARAKEKLPPLTPNPALFEVARAHSRNMAGKSTLQHDLDGKRPHQRVRESGYPLTWTGENIAYSSELQVQRIFDGWMASGGHRQNILSERFEDIGIGVATAPNGEVYYTQVFGAQR